MADPHERAREVGLQDVPVEPSEQASETTGRFQDIVRGTISELNNDLMERMQILMNSFGDELVRQVDARVKQAEDHLSEQTTTLARQVDARVKQIEDNLGGQATALARQVDARVKQAEDHLSRQTKTLVWGKIVGLPQTPSMTNDLSNFVPGLDPSMPNPPDSSLSGEEWTISRRILDLKEKVTTLDGQRAEFISEKQHLIAENESLVSIIADREKYSRTIRRLEREKAQGRAEVARLNSIIVERDLPDEGLDEEKLVQDYPNLLLTANEITRSHYISPIVRPLTPVVGLGEDERRIQQRRYEERWAGWDAFLPEDRNYQVRSLIFKILREEFFMDPLFGLEDRMENCLVAFETAIANSISSQDVIEWRRRTVAAALCLPRSVVLPRSVKARLWEKDLWDTLLPVLTWTANRRKPQEECKHALSVLCESALQLALDMRRTRTGYGIIIPKEGGLVGASPNSIMQDMTKCPQLARRHTQIAFVLSGALVRKAILPNPYSQYEVLEKAQVAGGLPI